MGAQYHILQNQHSVLLEDLDDLVERMEKAAAELKAMVKGRTSELGFEVIRLEGKAEGVGLALSYLRETIARNLP